MPGVMEGVWGEDIIRRRLMPSVYSVGAQPSANHPNPQFRPQVVDLWKKLEGMKTMQRADSRLWIIGQLAGQLPPDYLARLIAELVYWWIMRTKPSRGDALPPFDPVFMEYFHRAEGYDLEQIKDAVDLEGESDV